MKISDIREMSDVELREKLAEERKASSTLRFNNALTAIENPTKIRAARKNVAKILTVMNERTKAAKQS